MRRRVWTENPEEFIDTTCDHNHLVAYSPNEIHMIGEQYECKYSLHDKIILLIGHLLCVRHS